MEKLKNYNIEPIYLLNLFFDYIQKLDNYLLQLNKNKSAIPKGKRYYIIGELEGLDKLLAFFLNNNLMNDSLINEELKKLKKKPLTNIK